MAFTLTTIHPSGAETVSRPIMYGPQVVCAVSAILATTRLGLTRRERDRAGLDVARGRKGVPLVHIPSGLAFRVDVIETPPHPYAEPFTDDVAHTTLTLHT